MVAIRTFYAEQLFQTMDIIIICVTHRIRRVAHETFVFLSWYWDILEFSVISPSGENPGICSSLKIYAYAFTYTSYLPRLDNEKWVVKAVSAPGAESVITLFILASLNYFLPSFVVEENMEIW